jgi:hypothetical protein
MTPLFVFADPRIFRNFVNQIISELSKFPENQAGYVQGITIDLHPVWHELRMIAQYNITSNIHVRNDTAADIILAGNDFRLPEGKEFLYAPGWAEYAKQNDKDPSAPVIVKICVLPTTSGTFPIRRALVSLADTQPFYAIVEDRAEATLAANIEGGVETTVNYDGTFGGFLDESGTRYGFTCGHVGTTKGQNVDVEDASATRVTRAGEVLNTNFSSLPSSPIPSFCNPFANTLPDVNAAIIELYSPHVALNTVNRIGIVSDIRDRTQLWPGQHMVMRGARSGVNAYTVGALAVCYRFSYGGAYYCFRDMFEIRGKAPPALNPRLAQPLTPSSLLKKSAQGYGFDNFRRVCLNTHEKSPLKHWLFGFDEGGIPSVEGAQKPISTSC